ncbi:MAG: MATE family efflux transporter, partial [Gammaproteobacteria bacterium]|nr:MATE family efflux transporter [Gammaproteobacteria bacterium]
HIMAYGLDGFAHTAETLAGYAFGKRDAKGLRRASGYSAIWAGLTACLFSAACGLFGESLIALFTDLPEVRAAAAAYLPWVAALPLAAVWAFMLDGIFIGATRTVELRNAMILAAAIYLAVLWLSFEPLGNHGVWLSMLAFMAARGLILGAMYPKLERRTRSAQH